MARSDYIYLVSVGGIPAGAFTVKHELAHALYRHPSVAMNARVLRLRDGELEGGKLMAVAELRRQGYQEALKRWKRMLPEYRGPEPLPPE